MGAARELKRYGEAQDLVQQCIDAHPASTEAKQLFTDLEHIMAFATRSSAGDGKVKEQWMRQATEGSYPKGFAVKDVNSKKGFHAFAGYGDGRAGTLEKPPI